MSAPTVILFVPESMAIPRPYRSGAPGTVGIHSGRWLRSDADDSSDVDDNDVLLVDRPDYDEDGFDFAAALADALAQAAESAAQDQRFAADRFAGLADSSW